jgi:putative transcriptional regulator
VDELHPAVGAAGQGVKDLGIKDKGAEHAPVGFERVVERGMVEVAQIATKPDKGRGHDGVSKRLDSNGQKHARNLPLQSTARRLKIAPVTTTTINLTDHFLIAMPAMADPNFTRTLTYIAEHNENGAMGIIVNRPTDMRLATLFERIDIPFEQPDFADLPVYFGGPVQSDRGFVLHRPAGDWHSTLRVSDSVALTSSRDVLQSLANEGQPGEVLVALGYSGWSAGQLEHEIAQNAWLTVPASLDIVFSLPPEERLAAAMQLLGVDFAKLSDVAGHA